MANRYTNINWDNPISTFVPLPFQEISQAAGQFQADFDKTQQELKGLEALKAKVKPLEQVYTYKDGTLGYHNTNHDKIVNSYFNKLNSEVEDITEKLRSGAATYSDYKDIISKKGRELQQLMSPTGAFGQMNTQRELYDKQNEILKSSKDLQENPWLAHNVYKNRLGFIGGQNELELAGVGEKINRVKDVEDWLSNIKSEGGSYADALNGYIKSGNWDVISKSKIKEAFLGAFPQSDTFKDMSVEADHLISMGRLKPEDKNKWIASKGEELLKYAVGNFRMSKSDKHLSGDDTFRWYQDKKEKEVTDLDPVVEGAGPSAKGLSNVVDELTTIMTPSLNKLDPLKSAYGISSEPINIKAKSIPKYDDLSEDAKKVVDNYINNFADPKTKQRYEEYKNFDFTRLGNSKNAEEAIDKHSKFIQDIYKNTAKLAGLAQEDTKKNLVISTDFYDKGVLDRIFSFKEVLGNKSYTVGNLQNSLALNQPVYDPENNKIVNFKDYIGDADPKTPVQVTGVVSPDNFITSVTNEKKMANAMQVIVGGKPIYVMAPEHMKNSTGAIDKGYNDYIKHNELVNTISQQSAFKGNVKKIDNFDDLGLDVKVMYSDKGYTLEILNDFESSSSDNKGNKNSVKIDTKNKVFTADNPENLISEVYNYISDTLESTNK